MTDVATAERPIAGESRFYNARITRRVDLTESLAFIWVAFDGDTVPFEPGQYLTIGLESNGKLVQRPYSVANSPRELEHDGYEYYLRLVPEGLFTPLVWRVPVGHPIHMKGPKGKFLLEPNDERTHVFIASGTGIAPFICMMKTLQFDGTPRPVILLHGASYQHDLGYRELLERWEATGEYPVKYIATVSRPGAPENERWTGRVGRVEAIVPSVFDELALIPENSIAYICGNPDMIIAVEETLLGRGFPLEQVKKELYWPKGKGPAGVRAPGAPAPR
jgi:ferredoxin-NADP reductase